MHNAKVVAKEHFTELSRPVYICISFVFQCMFSSNDELYFSTVGISWMLNLIVLCGTDSEICAAYHTGVVQNLAHLEITLGQRRWWKDS